MSICTHIHKCKDALGKIVLHKGIVFNSSLKIKHAVFGPHRFWSSTRCLSLAIVLLCGKIVIHVKLLSLENRYMYTSLVSFFEIFMHGFKKVYIIFGTPPACVYTYGHTYVCT